MDRQMKLPLGKVENHILREIVFHNTGFRHPLVVDRASIGDDTASIRSEEGLWIVSTDPITAAASQIGSLAINISCNDIATRGIRPIAMTLAIMLPYSSTVGDLEDIMRSASIAASKMKIEIVGGHTEVTEAVNTPVVVSTAMGLQKKVATYEAEEGDLILMSKSAGIEGGGILAWDKDSLASRLSEKELAMAKELLEFTSVVEEGEIAGNIGFVKMHDVTEGGILGGVWEICESLKLGCLIEEDKILVEPVVEKISHILSIDYLKLISSGSMLIVIKKSQLEEYEKAFKEKNIKYSLIGKLTNVAEKKHIKRRDDKIEEILQPQKDELYRGLEA